MQKSSFSEKFMGRIGSFKRVFSLKNAHYRHRVKQYTTGKQSNIPSNTFADSPNVVMGGSMPPEIIWKRHSGTPTGTKLLVHFKGGQAVMVYLGGEFDLAWVKFAGETPAMP